MRFRLGFLACLLAGCATQPVPSTAPDAPTDHLAVLAAATGRPQCIGLEFLPPDGRFPELEPVQVEPERRRASKPTPSSRALTQVEVDDPEPSRLPSLSQIDLDAIEDPIARETLHFCKDLVAADRQRVRREVGIPFFDFRGSPDDLSPKLTMERRLEAEHDEWAQQHGVRLFRQPLRLLGKRLPIAREFEIAVEDFRSDHVPLSEPYREAHGDRRRLGRMSMRVHVRDVQDPVELVYIHPSGLRIGSSQMRAKMSYGVDLSNSLNLSVRARSDYDTGDFAMRADLIYRPATHVSVHLSAGDDMDFLSTSSLYSLFESPMDGRPGLLLYAVHTF